MNLFRRAKTDTGNEVSGVELRQIRWIMCLLGLRWAGRIPSVSDIARAARDLASELSHDDTLFSVESGGLRAWLDEDGLVHVCLEIEILPASLKLAPVVGKSARRRA